LAPFLYLVLTLVDLTTRSTLAAVAVPSVAQPAATAEVAHSAPIAEIAQHPYWLSLLHYQDKLLSGHQSEADGPAFFLSPNGNQDPEAELKATLAAFSHDSQVRVGGLKQHAQCAFPERLRFLRETLGLSVEKVACVQYELWKQKHRPESLTLVYAAPFLGSPASMFGHTFLRVNQVRENRQEHEVLDLAIGFEAFTGEDAGVDYVLKGVIGMYPGLFSFLPYYMKLNAYTDMESRDLWEYELSLSPEQIDRMLSHLWELGNTHFNYYFFDENCSYQLLALLEIANPEWNLADQFPRTVIPGDTVKAVARVPGAIRKVSFRPAILDRVERSLDGMNRTERLAFERLKRSPETVSPDDGVKVVDAALDWHKHISKTRSKTLLDHQQALPVALLSTRAAMPATATSEEAFDPLERPDRAHHSSSVSFLAGTDTRQPFTGVELRPSLHDYLDLDHGYLPYSWLTMLRGRLELFQRPSGGVALRLQDLTLVGVGTRAPYSSIRRNFSWEVQTGFLRPKLPNKLGEWAYQTRGGIGIAAETLGVSYAMAQARVELSPAYRAIARVSPVVEIGHYFEIGNFAKLQINTLHERFFPIETRWKDGLWELGVTASAQWRQFNLRGGVVQRWWFPTVRDQRIFGSLGWYF
jgi:hypothetical protein